MKILKINIILIKNKVNIISIEVNCLKHIHMVWKVQRRDKFTMINKIFKIAP